MKLTYHRTLQTTPRRSLWPLLVVGGIVLSGASISSLAAQSPKHGEAKPPQAAEVQLPQGGEAECGSLDNGTAGPYDYRDGSSYVRRQLNLVNRNHFTEGVQTLKGGQTSVYVLGDLDFVLRHFPNHYPALQSVTNYFLQGGSVLDFRTAECYFDRAMRFVPDDLQVRLLYAIYLEKKGRLPDAIAQMERALDLSPTPSMELHYNLALLYVDAKNFEKANYHASIAYAMGHPLPGLRDRLQRLGEWRPVHVQIEGKDSQPPTAASSETTTP